MFTISIGYNNFSSKYNWQLYYPNYRNLYIKLRASRVAEVRDPDCLKIGGSDHNRSNTKTFISLWGIVRVQVNNVAWNET